MINYFSIDQVPSEGENPLYEYPTEAEFLKTLYENRLIAKENGDQVPSLKSIGIDLKQHNCDFSFNGFYFIKGIQTLADYGYKGESND